MKVKDEGNIEKEAQYMSKNISTQIKVGEDYKNLKPSIVIIILNFNRYKRNSYHQIAHMKFEKIKKKNTQIWDIKKKRKKAKEVLQMHFIELLKFIKKKSRDKEKIRRMAVLNSGKEGKNKDVKARKSRSKKAMKLVEEIMSDPKEREII